VEADGSSRFFERPVAPSNIQTAVATDPQQSSLCTVPGSEPLSSTSKDKVGFIVPGELNLPAELSASLRIPFRSMAATN
jgi:hypothetical protein